MACDESFQEPEPLLWPYLKLFFSLLFLFQPLWICCSSTILGSFPFWGFSTDFFSCLFCSLLTYQLRSVQFSLSLMSDSLQPHGLQYTRLPCPSPAPGTCSNLCPLRRWCHPAISPCRLLLPPPSVFPSIKVFSSDSVLCIRWPKYWSFRFNISPSNEYSGLVSFRMDWLDLLAVQGTL